MNIVQIEHKGYPVRYTFEVPEGVRLHKGDIVQVKNKRGYHIVECVTDNHEVDDELLDMIMDGKQVTASVTGIYNLTKFGEKTEDERELAKRIKKAIKEGIDQNGLNSNMFKIGYEDCKNRVLNAMKEGGNDNKRF